MNMELVEIKISIQPLQYQFVYSDKFQNHHTANYIQEFAFNSAKLTVLLDKKIK